MSIFATGLPGPTGVAFDSAGNLYAANEANNTIAKITPGGVVSIFASGLNGPNGLAFDRAGNLFVTNTGSSNIVKFTLDGTGSVFANFGLAGSGLAFDNVGNLYVPGVVNNMVTIEKFTPGGVGSVFAPPGIGLNGPRWLALTDDAGVPLKLPNQAPEPASALLLLGSATGLLALRRRRG